MAAGREGPATKKEGPEALQLLEPSEVGHELQLFAALRHRPRREQPHPLRTVEGSK